MSSERGAAAVFLAVWNTKPANEAIGKILVGISALCVVVIVMTMSYSVVMVINAAMKACEANPSATGNGAALVTGLTALVAIMKRALQPTVLPQA
jgi:hypothetical protein